MYHEFIIQIRHINTPFKKRNVYVFPIKTLLKPIVVYCIPKSLIYKNIRIIKMGKYCIYEQSISSE